MDTKTELDHVNVIPEWISDQIHMGNMNVLDAILRAFDDRAEEVQHKVEMLLQDEFLALEDRDSFLKRLPKISQLPIRITINYKEFTFENEILASRALYNWLTKEKHIVISFKKCQQLVRDKFDGAYETFQLRIEDAHVSYDTEIRIPTLSFEDLQFKNISNQLTLGSGNIITINAPTPGTSRVHRFPDVGETASFVMTETNGTINGPISFTSM